MKKVIMVLPLILIINKAVAQHRGLSNDEYFLFYILAAILIIWLIAIIIRKKYIRYKAQISATVQDPERKASVIKGQSDIDNEIPGFFKEKDLFGLDKPSINVDVDASLPDTKKAT
jgi:hypothetical protein